MRFLILLLSFFFITFTTSARAQEIYMNCKFFSGFFRPAGGGVIEEIFKSPDLSIVLNKSKKLVMSENSAIWVKYIDYSSKNEIDWMEREITYTLNLINGNLKLFGEAFKNTMKSFNYQCEKVQKKF